MIIIFIHWRGDTQGHKYGPTASFDMVDSLKHAQNVFLENWLSGILLGFEILCEKFIDSLTAVVNR